MERDWLKISLIISPVFALMAGASYYLWLDYAHDRAPAQTQINREIFGTFSFVDNSVKRKTSDSVLWNGAAKDETLYFQDSIRTGPNSYAVIKLRDGSVIEISENSLIVLEKNSNQLGVDFKTGNLRTVGLTNNIAIRIKGTKINTQGAEVNVKAGPDKNAQVVVTKGRALITAPDQNRRYLSPQDLVNIDQKGTPQTLTLPLLLDQPADKVKLVSAAAESKYQFTWKVFDKNLREEVLEVSTDPAFKPEMTKSVVAHQAATALVKQGVNYWRVGWKPAKIANSVRPALLYSETRSLSVHEDSRIRLLTPVNGVAFELNEKDSDIEFTWSADGQPASFVHEISDQPGFAQITRKTVTAAPNVKVAGMKTGKYWWRVTAFASNKSSIGSAVPRSFEVKKTIPALPILLKPDPAFTWASNLPVRFEWRKLDEASRYRVTVSRDRAQSVVLKNVTVSNSPYAWAWTEPGSYFWSVEALDETNETYARSETRAFTTAAAVESSRIALTLPA
ncbi:MAG: FecR domain-containing protein, partial [Bdellovibrionia bacterium]